MGIELHPNGHAQKGKSCHEHIARNLFHPRDTRSEEISHNDINGDDGHLKRQESAGEDGADKMDRIKSASYLHEVEIPSFEASYFEITLTFMV